MRQRGNCCKRKSNGMAILWLLVHLWFYLKSAEPSAVTRGLCSNLPKFAALPRIIKICHFQTNWQFLHKKKILVAASWLLEHSCMYSTSAKHPITLCNFVAPSLNLQQLDEIAEIHDFVANCVQKTPFQDSESIFVWDPCFELLHLPQCNIPSVWRVAASNCIILL